jgi:hypothetical protein
MPYVDDEVFGMVVAGMCNRQIARKLHIDPATADSKIERLGRHCLLFLAKMLLDAPPVVEAVIDGFETFELSQYYPFHHNAAVEKGTDFIIYFNDSELRRKGRMTALQEKRRAQLELQHGKPDPKAIQNAIAELLSVVVQGQETVTIYSDGHPHYRHPIRTYGSRIKHLVIPGRQHRSKNNMLWEINLFDRFLRHSNSNHVRETLAWSKRRQSSADRLAIFAVWRNYINGRRQKDRRSPTPAMARGMLDCRLTSTEVLSERIFIDHIELPKAWRQYYWREVRTRALPVNRTHQRFYAA